jgi:hypothetical protein
MNGKFHRIKVKGTFYDMRWNGFLIRELVEQAEG